MAGRLLLRWMQKTDFAIQYKLLLLVWKEHVGYLCFDSDGVHVDSTGTLWSCATTKRGEMITKNITVGESDVSLLKFSGAPRHT